jgi:hypothetical protein
MADEKPKRNRGDRSEEYRKRNAKRRATTTNKLNAKALEGIKKTPPKGFSLIKEIKDSPFYGKHGNDERARKLLKEQLNQNKKKHVKIRPGQLIIFKYFDPIHKEELEYYDASPCTIFFGMKSVNGKPHVIGFNIHYYPPQMRYQVMNTIFKMYDAVYKRDFDGVSKTISDISYKTLLNSLAKAKLDFGVREYAVSGCSEVTYIPPNYWQVAVFTEGWFKKQTREAILNYWKRFISGAKEKPKEKTKEKTPKNI